MHDQHSQKLKQIARLDGLINLVVDMLAEEHLKDRENEMEKAPHDQENPTSKRLRN